MKEVSDLILKILRKDDSLVNYEDIEKHNTVAKVAENSKAKRDLGYRNSVNLEEGLRRTIEWQKRIYFETHESS